MALAGLLAYTLVLFSFRNLPRLWAHSFFKLAAHLAIGDIIILIISLIHWIPSLYKEPKVPLYGKTTDGILSTVAVFATWLIYLNTAAIAINRLIGAALNPVTASHVIKNQALTFCLLATIWVPLLAGLGLFGFFHCYIFFTNENLNENFLFQFDRKCLKDEKITAYLYLFGYILCLVCILITIISYSIVALKLRFYKKHVINSAQFRHQQVEKRLFYQGALIALALLLEYVCSYFANFHDIAVINHFFLLSIIFNSCVNPWILLMFNANVKHQVLLLLNWRQRGAAPERRFSQSATIDRIFGSIRRESNGLMLCQGGETVL